MMTRRYFLKSAGLGLTVMGASQFLPGFLHGATGAVSADTAKAASGKQLVVIFQRGAADGLNIVVPFAERAYYDMRPGLAIPEPNKTNPAAALDLDGKFGLNPALAALKPLFDTGQLAAIHAVGSPDNTRSHFDAQDYMESATPGRKSTQDGWLNRYLQTVAQPGATPFRAVSMTQLTPRAMQGKADVIAMSNINDFTLKTGAGGGSVNQSFEQMYAQATTDALRGTGHETFDAVNFLKKANPGQYRVANGAQYPKGKFGEAMRQIAQLIKANVGLEVAFTDMGGWDTHINQGAPGAPNNQLARLLKELGDSLAAFHQDLGDRMKNVVVVTMTEFGRTVRQNGTGGTDHGHGSNMFILGGTVKGGKVYGKWPGLSSNDLYEGRDLAVTTDFRDVFAEVLLRHLGDKNLKPVLPEYAIDERRFLGVL
ncbi:MAG: DUF1501 domain-containing protein [Blastocatellia bacterium]|nr:DUF1501 domain-containing protein [Blastocatellia bacterium]